MMKCGTSIVFVLTQNDINSDIPTLRLILIMKNAMIYLLCISGGFIGCYCMDWSQKGINKIPIIIFRVGKVKRSVLLGVL